MYSMGFYVSKTGQLYAKLHARSRASTDLKRWNDKTIVEHFAFVFENEAFLNNRSAPVRFSSISGLGSASSSQSGTDSIARRLNLVTLMGLASSAEQSPVVRDGLKA